MATRGLFLRKTLQVLLALVLVLLIVSWFQASNPPHLANLAWTVFLVLTIMLLGPWWGNRMAVGAFISIVLVTLAFVVIQAYAWNEISKKVHACFREKVSTSSITTSEMQALLDHAVVCAKGRASALDRFFWDDERAKNSIKVKPALIPDKERTEKGLATQKWLITMNELMPREFCSGSHPFRRGHSGSDESCKKQVRALMQRCMSGPMKDSPQFLRSRKDAELLGESLGMCVFVGSLPEAGGQAK